MLTGVSGFVGAALLRRLQRGGYDVTVIARSPIAGLPDSVSQVLVSESWSVANFRSAFAEGVTTVVHLAARVHIMRDKTNEPLAEFRIVNRDATLNLARQAAAAGAKRFIYMSSVKVNGEATQSGRAFTEADIPAPLDAYGLSKYEAELGLSSLGEETGLAIVVIRPPLVYGPGVRGNFATLLNAVRRGWPLPLAAVHNKRSLVALDNLLDFIAACLTHPDAANQTFLVGDGHDISTAQLVRELASAAGVPAHLFSVPVWALQGGAALVGKGEMIHRVCGNLQVDISKAQRLLHWKPPISVDEGLRRAVAGN